MRLRLLIVICFSFLNVFFPTLAAFGDAGKNQEPSLVFPLKSDLENVESASSNGSGAARASVANSPGPHLAREVKRAISLPAAWMPLDAAVQTKVILEVHNKFIPTQVRPHDRNFRDPIVQDSPFSSDISVIPNTPVAGANFDGVGFTGWYPPDTNGDVGPNHYLQTVNVSWAVFNKTGAKLLGPSSIGSLFTAIGTPCSGNYGDPIGLYDPIANRFVISQFTTVAPYHQCIAVSQTADPTGSWYLYDFLWSATNLNDYPHFGVWPDGYYMSTNEFANGASFVGAGAAVFERDKMLLGQSARMVAFHNLGASPLPSDLDGSTLPAAGMPNIFANISGTTLRLSKFHVDWNNTANSTFTSSANLTVSSYSSAASAPQPGTTMTLASLSDRLMYRLAYRNFGSYDALVVTHSVSSGGISGVRWYEVRNPNSAATLFQQGTFAPADGVYRWMGSVAMDSAGDIAAGYSVSNSISVFPGIRYTGRIPSDPAGQFPQGEGTMISGGGSQTGVSRWGDYSMLSVDPVDDCTFWYTTEYQATTASVSWKTRIGSFKFSNCGSGGGCTPPSVTSNNTAADKDACASTGVLVTWPADPANWNDGGTGTRTYDVLRDGTAIASGLASGTTSYTDIPGNTATHTYVIRYNNGCGSSTTTAGATAADANNSQSIIQTSNQSTSLTAKNNTKTSTIAPAFTIGAGQASLATLTWTLAGNTNLTTCASVRLRSPDGSETTLKAAGAANTGSATVTIFYNAEGPGTYTIVLQELSGCGSNSQRATLTSGQMKVTRPGTCP